MKLCKDCKHYSYPILNIYHGPTIPIYPYPMCAHPKAIRSRVDGDLLHPCQDMRSDEKMCGDGAELFEERAPDPIPAKKTCFWQRIFGG